jgi:hypothetical protein
MSWQSQFTSKFQLILWTEGTKYHSQVSHLVRPHQSFYFYANARIGQEKNNSRTISKRLNFSWFLNLVLFIVLFLKNFNYSCFMNFAITILLSLFLPSSLSLLLLCYNPSQLLILPFSSTLSPIVTSPFSPPATCHHTTSPSYTLTTC